MTLGDKSKLLSAEPDVQFVGDQAPAANELAIRVDPFKTFQTMDGFGAALTDSSAWLINTKLSASKKTTLMNNLFTASGAQTNLVRVPMGSSDFARTLYTYNDLPNPTDSDVNQTTFSVAHDLQDMIPVLRDAQTKNSSVKALLVPWSAPRWMKQNVPF